MLTNKKKFNKVNNFFSNWRYTQLLVISSITKDVIDFIKLFLVS